MSKPVSFLLDDLINNIKKAGDYISAIQTIEIIAESQNRTIQQAAAYLYHNGFGKFAPMYIQTRTKRNEFESELSYSKSDSKYSSENWHQTNSFLHTVKWGGNKIFTNEQIQQVVSLYNGQKFFSDQEIFLMRWKDYYWAITDLLNFEPIINLNIQELRGIKPDWNYWLKFYELQPSELISLSLGVNPLGMRAGYSSLLDEIVVSEGSKKLEVREEILLSYIGNEGHPFVFKNEDKLSKMHAKIKIQDFVIWAKNLGWELPEELINNFTSNEKNKNDVFEHDHLEYSNLLNENVKLKEELRNAKLLITQLEMDQQENSRIHPALDQKNKHHAPELLLAIHAWESKYIHEQYPHHDHTPAIKAFLSKSGYTVQRLQERIAAITNPKNINKSKT